MILYALLGLLFQASAFGSYYFPVNFLGQSMTITGKFVSSSDESFVLERARIVDGKGVKSYIAANGGWGSIPLNTICDQVTSGQYPFAQSYGVVDTPSMFGPSSIMVFWANRNSGELREIEMRSKRGYQGLIYKDLYCSRDDWEY